MLSKCFKARHYIEGVVIDQETLKFTMFADDVLLFLSGTNDQFSRIIDVLLEFSNHSNCKINLSKCQAFHISSNRNCVDKPFIDKDLKWPTEAFKYLGVLVPVKECYDNAKKLQQVLGLRRSLLTMFQGYERTLNVVLWAHLFSSFASYMT